jgi:multiple sugar transport system substrate-binding protein
MGPGLSRRRLLASVAAGSAALALGGCGRSDALTFWAIGNEAAALPALLDRHGLGTVRVQPLPWSGAHQKLLTGFVGESLPDLAQVGNSWLGELDAIGALAPAPGDVTGDSDPFPAVIGSNRIAGRLIAVPWYVDTRVQFYRSDLFARAGYAAPPLEWAAWKRALARVRALAGGETFGVLLPLDEFEHLQTFALSAGAGFLRDGGTRGAFGAPEFVEALGFYKSLFDDGLAPVVTGAQIANRWAEFTRGWFAVYPSGPWMIGEMRERLPPAMQGKWATAPHPGPDGIGASAPGGSSLVVFAGGARQREAWDVVRRLLRPDAQLALHRATGDLPAMRSAWTGGALAADPVVAPFARQIDHARPLPKVPEWERIVTEMQVVAERMVRGEFTVRGAAREMDRRVDRILAKRRWMAERGKA